MPRSGRSTSPSWTASCSARGPAFTGGSALHPPPGTWSRIPSLRLSRYSWETVIVQMTLRKIGNRLGILPRSNSEGPTEVGADWYDRCYTETPTYRDHYTRSSYYPLWTVIVDRVRRDKVKRILEIGCGPGQLAAFLLDQGVES